MTVNRSTLALLASLALVALAGCATAVPGRALPLADAAAQAQSAPASSVPALTDGSAAAQPSAAPGAPIKATPWPPVSIPEGKRADPQIVDSGFTAYDVEYTGKVISYGLKVKNPNPSSWVASSVDLDVKFTDDAGKVIWQSTFEAIYTINPGATTALGETVEGGDLQDVTTQPTKMVATITDVDWFSTDDVAPGTITFGPAKVKPGTRDSGADSVVVSCDATSSYRSKLGSGSVEILYLDQAGKIIGGNSDNSNLDHDTISLAGESVTPVEVEELFTPPNGVPAAACYPSFVGPI
jgi:hypothetical protein